MACWGRGKEPAVELGGDGEEEGQVDDGGGDVGGVELDERLRRNIQGRADGCHVGGPTGVDAHEHGRDLVGIGDGVTENEACQHAHDEDGDDAEAERQDGGSGHLQPGHDIHGEQQQRYGEGHGSAAQRKRDVRVDDQARYVAYPDAEQVADQDCRNEAE